MLKFYGKKFPAKDWVSDVILLAFLMPYFDQDNDRISVILLSLWEK